MKSTIKGRDSVMQLYRAVVRYVKANGGQVVVIGGVEMQEWSADGKQSYRIAVKCTGKRPEFASCASKAGAQ